MAVTEARRVRRSWPIIYGRRGRATGRYGTGLAWALFLALGIPFVLMTVLTVLARAGIYVDVFRPLWEPWPPDLLKPFLGVAVFAATLAYLAYRVGHRHGFREGSGVAIVMARSEAEGPAVPVAREAAPEALPVPPPPPVNAPDDWA